MKILILLFLVYSLWFLWKYIFNHKNKIITFGDNKISKVLKNCSIIKSYHQHLFFPEGNLMTVFSVLLRSSPDIKFKRETIPTEDGGEVTLDWMIDSMDLNDNSPIIVVFPGLTGSIDSNYLLHFCKFYKKLASKIVVYTSRGCGTSRLLSPQMFCGSYTSDVKITVSHLKNKYPNSKLIGVSYSLGANVLVKYLGEEGENSKFDFAISLANPLDMYETGKHMRAGFLQKNFYSPGLVAGLKAYVSRHQDMFKKMLGLDFEKVAKMKTVYEFDSLVVAKLFKYESADHYYKDASSSRFLKELKTPLLIVNSMDDPIVPPLAVKIVDNPNVCYVLTEKGGHVSWLSSFSVNESWIDLALVEFINKMLSD